MTAAAWFMLGVWAGFLLNGFVRWVPAERKEPKP